MRWGNEIFSGMRYLLPLSKPLLLKKTQILTPSSTQALRSYCCAFPSFVLVQASSL